MFTAICLALLLIFIGSLWSQSRHKYGRKLPPGPLSLPIIGNLHMLTSLPHRGLHKLAKKYGPIMSFKLGHVQTIVVSSPQAAELFLKTHDAVFASRPKLQASEYLDFGTKGVVLTEYGPYWRNVRKLCTQQLLTTSKIETFAALRREELGGLVESLKMKAVACEVVDVSRKVAELLGDITSRMILGRSTKDERYHDLEEVIEEAFSLAGAFNLADYVPYLGPFDLQGFTKRLKKASETIDQVLEKIIVEHEQTSNQQKGHHKDFVDILLSFMNQPMNPRDEHVFTMDRTNIKAILFDMIAGALDTSAVTIEWTLSELLRNPRVMKNLQEELENVIGMDQMVEEKDLGKLVYLDMVIKESFRLHPVGPLLSPHASMEDITIKGYYIPKNSRIIVNIWAIGRDPNVWSPNVDEFYPERFFGSNIDVRGHDFQLLPFGSGRRGCPGIQLGLITVRLVVAQLVHCFNWELPCGIEPKDIDITEKFGLSVGKADHLLAKPTYRLLK